mmetsp:Transcript_5380/g.19376  ORF Transcript_5380/g.19376 Transcript_5380/m.19376 type:complete len:217 (-) Transcript_5380:923-1573(-)
MFNLSLSCLTNLFAPPLDVSSTTLLPLLKKEVVGRPPQTLRAVPCPLHHGLDLAPHHQQPAWPKLLLPPAVPRRLHELGLHQPEVALQRGLHAKPLLRTPQPRHLLVHVVEVVGLPAALLQALARHQHGEVQDGELEGLLDEGGKARAGVVDHLGRKRRGGRGHGTDQLQDELLDGVDGGVALEEPVEGPGGRLGRQRAPDGLVEGVRVPRAIRGS